MSLGEILDKVELSRSQQSLGLRYDDPGNNWYNSQHQQSSWYNNEATPYSNVPDFSNVSNYGTCGFRGYMAGTIHHFPSQNKKNGQDLTVYQNGGLAEVPLLSKSYFEQRSIKPEATSPSDFPPKISYTGQSTLSDLAMLLCPATSEEFGVYDGDEIKQTDTAIGMPLPNSCEAPSLPDVDCAGGQKSLSATINYVSSIAKPMFSPFNPSTSGEPKYCFPASSTISNQCKQVSGIASQHEKEDISYATFDPSKPISDDDLKIHPIIRKAKKVPVADQYKDSKYWKRRLKNNVAARRSREAKRIKENQIAVRAKYLEKENARLQMEVKSLRRRIRMSNQNGEFCDEGLGL